MTLTLPALFSALFFLYSVRFAWALPIARETKDQPSSTADRAAPRETSKVATPAKPSPFPLLALSPLGLLSLSYSNPHYSMAAAETGGQSVGQDRELQ